MNKKKVVGSLLALTAVSLLASALFACSDGEKKTFQAEYGESFALPYSAEKMIVRDSGGKEISAVNGEFFVNDINGYSVQVGKRKNAIRVEVADTKGPQINVSQNILYPSINETVDFGKVTAYDAYSGEVEPVYTLARGETEEKIDPLHVTFEQTGVYTVKISATDDNGNHSEECVFVDVSSDGKNGNVIANFSESYAKEQIKLGYGLKAEYTTEMHYGDEKGSLKLTSSNDLNIDMAWSNYFMLNNLYRNDISSDLGLYFRVYNNGQMSKTLKVGDASLYPLHVGEWTEVFISPSDFDYISERMGDKNYNRMTDLSSIKFEFITTMCSRTGVDEYYFSDIYVLPFVNAQNFISRLSALGNLQTEEKRAEYITNNWNIEKHKVMDTRFPATFEHIKDNMRKWCDENKNVNVVRYTTFLYHFFLVFNEINKEKHVDWFGYPMTASPRAFDDFEKEYGYTLKAEDIVAQGTYQNNFVNPTKKFLDYMEFTEKYVTKTVRELIDIVHAEGKEAMMFLGDSWIGTEPYGEHFKDLNLDAIVGSVGGGVTVRMLSDMPHVKYREGRFLPYFFPDTFFEGNEENAVEELNRNWVTARRAMMRNPIDRIGFGGYLELAAKFPKFIERAGQVCDEFRYIYDTVKTQTPKNFAKVAILNAWGKKRSWMGHMVAHELWYQQVYSYQGVYEALSGLPVDVQFINFDDVRAGRLDEFDVVINVGDAGTAWSGGDNWTDEKVLTEVRKFVHNGGGFIGVGEPTAHQANGKFFQLSDVLGVEKECGLTLSEDKYNISANVKHFILDGVKTPVDYGEDKKNIYALDSANILDISISDRFTRKVNVGEVKMATNVYGKGRSFYITGLPYSAQNAKLLYRAILWTASKEDMDKKSYCTNPLTEAHFYGDRYAIINNTPEKQVADFYDIDGKCQAIELRPYEIKWIFN